MECADGQIAHQAFVFLAQIRRTEINRIVAVVLGLFVVKLRGRNNPHAGQGAAIQYAASVFAAADKGFGNNLTTKLLQFVIYLFQTACFFYFHHADTAALICGLDEHRQSELPFYGIEIAVVAQHGIIRHRQTQTFPQQLAAVFVHTDGRSQHAATGVADTECLQRTLHRAVFAEHAMQNIKRTIKTLCFQLTQRRFFRVERMGIHTFAAQCLQYCLPAGEGNLALAGKTAHQYGYFTKILHNFLLHPAKAV